MRRFFRASFLPILAALIALGIGLFGALHGAPLPLLRPAGQVGMMERDVLLVTLLLSGLVIVPVFFLLFLFAWLYRANGPRSHEKHEPNWDHDSWYIEAWWWLVPMAIIAVLGAVVWRSSHDLDPYRPLPQDTPVITVDVVALQWKWLFIYPDQHIATVNDLVIPAGARVHFLLTADAPMNSFWVPALGGQIMVMPGMQTQLWLSGKPGAYEGFSANLSGDGFADMHFPVEAMQPDDFRAWVAQAKQGEPLDAKTYARLAAPSRQVPAMTYGSVDPALYTAIIMNAQRPGALDALIQAEAAAMQATSTGTTTGMGSPAE